MRNKTGLITPFLMLLAGALASIIMYIRGFELYTMLWVLLIVLLVFYVIGDIVRYIYASIKPRIIPNFDYDDIVVPVRISSDNSAGNVVELENFDKEADLEYEADTSDETLDGEEYSEEDLEKYSDEDDEA